MFQKFLRIQTPQKKKTTISESQCDLISIFSEHISLYSHMNSEEEKKQIIERMISHFQQTFEQIDLEYLRSNEIKTCIDDYCRICLKNNNLILKSRETRDKLYNSLMLVFNIFGEFQDGEDFYHFFIDLTKETKDILESSFDFISVLFKSKVFQNEFIKENGYLLIFEGFFNNYVSDECEKFFINLLFEQDMKDYYNFIPSNDFLKTLADSLQKNDGYKSKYKTVFIVDFLSSFCNIDPNIFDKFECYDGYFHLANYVIRYSNDMIYFCFLKLLSESDSCYPIVKSFYYLYTISDPETRTIIISILSSYDNFNFENINKFYPINLWILKPPELNSKGLILLIILLKNLSEYGKIKIKNSLDSIINLILPPGDKDVPIDQVLELIETSILKKELTPEDLLGKKFFEEFIFTPNDEDLAYYFEEHELFGSLVASIYSSECAEDYRFLIIQKFIHMSKYLKNMDSFISFLSDLFTKEFSTQIVSLLLNFLSNSYFINLLSNELSKQEEGFDYFVKANGFCELNEFVSNNSYDNLCLLKLLASLSNFYFHHEIDEWIISQPKESKLFKCDKELIKKAIYSFRSDTEILHLPSLLYFVDDFNSNISINLYQAGKYGIPLFNKFGVSITQIPHYIQIVNQYIDVETKEQIFEHSNIFSSFFNIVNLNPFSFYEFIPDSLTSSKMIVPFRPTLSFNFNFPIINNENSDFLNNNFLNIMNQGVYLIISSKNDKFSIRIEQNKWHHVDIKISKKLELNFDNNDKHTIDIDPTINNDFTFGSDNLKTRFLLFFNIPFADKSMEFSNHSKSVYYFNNQNIINGSVFYIHYTGIITYYSSFLQLEKIFLFLENSMNNFHEIVSALFIIEDISNLDSNYFWKRLFLSFKRLKDKISSELPIYLFNIPVSIYKTEKLANYFEAILKEIEFYYLFPNEIILSILKMINNYLEKKIINFSSNKESQLIVFLIHTMRTGLDESISLIFIQIIKNLILSNPTKANFMDLFNAAISSSDWNNTTLDTSSFCDKAMPKSIIHIKLLKVFISLARNSKIILFSYSELLGFMLLFDDERSLVFAELISFYSYLNPKYISESKIASLSFSKQCESINCWILAFSILSGEISKDIFPSKITISRTLFLPVIIEMLSKLIYKILLFRYLKNKNKSGNLVQDILNLIQTIPNFTPFLQQSCYIPLMILENLGIISQTMEIPPMKLSKYEFKNSFALCDKIEPFLSLIQKNKQIIQAHVSPSFYGECLPLEIDINFIRKKSIFTSIISIFTSIIFSTEPSNFANLLDDFIMGNSQMDLSYWHYFAKELIFNIIIKILNSKVSSDLYYKSIITLISKYIQIGFFNNNYLNLLSLILSLFELLKLEEKFELFLNDPIILNAFRKILISTFILIPKSEIVELYQLFISYKTIVFYPPIFSNIEFSFFWVNYTRRCNIDSPDIMLSLKLFMDIFDINEHKFKADDVEFMWNDYVQKFRNETFDSKSRDKKSKLIINYTNQKLLDGSKQYLMTSIYRISNFYIQTQHQCFAINLRNLQYEQDMYKFFKISNTYKMQSKYNIKSYHLSYAVLPLYQTKVLVPSTYEIRALKPEEKMDINLFSMEKNIAKSRIPQIINNGILQSSPEWFYFHTNKEFSSPFEYSKILPQNPSQIIQLFSSIFSDLGHIDYIVNSSFLYSTHLIECTFILTEKAISIILLSKYNNSEIILLKQPKFPIAFLQVSEAITLNEWNNSSLFCGHFVLTIYYHQLVKVQPHYYLHKKCSLSFDSMFNPNLIIVFDSVLEADSIEKKIQKIWNKNIFKELPPYQFLFNIPSQQNAFELWNLGIISNFDYLLVLNHFGGRTFTDLTQYPIFPWIVSPIDLEKRDLSLPIGEIFPEKANYYKLIYESADYYFGFHYSFPGIVFWYLMRISPFIFLQWDMNNGWDDSQRLFVSISDAYLSAVKKNTSDLKELIPAMYAVPEIYRNILKIKFSANVNEDVLLPSWANNSSSFYVDVMMKFLQSSEDLNEWINLIFGYKELGEPSYTYKNVYHPACYLYSTPESLKIDPEAFKAQVINFGQCPIQLFTKPHLKRAKQFIDPNENFEIITKQTHNYNCLYELLISKTSNLYTIIPPINKYYITIEPINEILIIQDINKIILIDKNPIYSNATNISISNSGMFLSISFSTGFVNVYRIIYESKEPHLILKLSSYYNNIPCYLSTIFSCDFICCSIFTNNHLIIWNYSTNLLHHDINLDINVQGIFCDDFTGLITIYSTTRIIQYSINGEKLHDINTDYLITSCKLFSISATFDGRFIITTSTTGHLLIYQTDSHTYQFKEIKKKLIHNSKITSMFIEQKEQKIVTSDILNNICYTTLLKNN